MPTKVAGPESEGSLTCMSPSVDALHCHGLTRSFAKVAAVDDFHLRVPDGSLTALLGPSGCGKTTVLRMIAGLEAADAGRIEVHGQVVTDGQRVVAPERRNIGMVFQDYALFPHLTVAQNIGYGLRSLGRKERRVRVGEALELVGLMVEADRLPGALSGGQQQRVAIARALAPRPAILLLDEPFSNLDAAMRTTVRADVRRILTDAGTSALFVTHDQEEALSLADRVAVMNEGRLHQVDTPTALYAAPATAFVARFVGDADVIPARPAGSAHVATSLGRLVADGPVAGATQAMVRPEHLDVASSDDGPAIVEDVQFFGHDQLLRLRLDDGTIVHSRRGPDVELPVGTRVRLRVQGRVRIFSGEMPAREDHADAA